MKRCACYLLISTLMFWPSSAFAGNCASTAACPNADVNCDNNTDGFDIAVVRNTSNWLKPIDAAAEPRADVNGDGVVDGFDIAEIRNTACWLRAGITAAELAGVGLVEYPHFDFVRAFNENAPVEVALDPTRLAAIVGQTCDIYVVEAKSRAEWDADPDLVDVTPGGPLTATFSGESVTENTFTVAAGGELDGDAGAGFGVGYDVVLDCDQDSELGGGDIIDGYGDEAGLYIVHDTTQPGPLAVTEIVYSGGAWLGQDTHFPTAIAAMGQLPLVVISHGNGHDYRWYDYLQNHLASYGYIVMSHQNQTGPGIESASSTTLNNTEYLLANQAVISGGVLNGHIDSSRIVWIGHSRGGEGVCRAVDRLFDGAFVPQHYTLDDLALVSSIAPNDYLGRNQSHPHSVNYHLLHGSADGDNGGWPDLESDAPFHVYERAEGNRQMTHVHGADHNDFNCCGFDDFAGPPGTAIGREEAQRVAKGAYLALIKHYLDGNLAASDYLWRQYETLRPIGVAASTIVSHEYREGPGDTVFVIDDFQSQSADDTSSSGGAVDFDVQNAWEGRMDDTDGTFTWLATDPMNGMSRGRVDDLARALVFDWSVGSARFCEFEVAPAAGDFTAYAYLSFRACQGTRHPETAAELGDVTFTVTLRDETGASSSINFGAYGAGIEEPYQRTGSGVGAGWQNEFETIRIRLTDFAADGASLDLSRIEAVSFGFGGVFGSDRGRLAIDDIQLSK